VDHAVERLRDLPHLLDAELPDLWLAVLAEAELLDRDAGQMAPAALRQHCDLGLDVGPRLEVAERLAVLATSLVARADADDGAVLHDQLRRRGLGQDVRAGLLDLLLLIARERRDRDHLVPVVLEVRYGEHRHRKLDLAVRERVHGLLDHLAEREPFLAPVLARQIGEQVEQWLGPHHGAGHEVPAARLRLLHDRDGHLAEALHQRLIVAEQLQQPVGAREPGRAAADDHDADVDPIVLGVEPVLDELLDRVDGWRKLARRVRPAAVAR
jgi:hypothetical protein